MEGDGYNNRIVSNNYSVQSTKDFPKKLFHQSTISSSPTLSSWPSLFSCSALSKPSETAQIERPSYLWTQELKAPDVYKIQGHHKLPHLHDQFPIFLKRNTNEIDGQAQGTSQIVRTINSSSSNNPEIWLAKNLKLAVPFNNGTAAKTIQNDENLQPDDDEQPCHESEENGDNNDIVEIPFIDFLGVGAS